MNKFRDITILQSACGSPSAPGGINAVKKNGERNIRVVGVDMSADPSIQYYVVNLSQHTIL